MAGSEGAESEGKYVGPDRSGKVPLVSVVIVTWNSEEDILRCLTAVSEQTWPHVEVLVLDNASTDSTVELVQEKHPEVTLLRSDTNLGYAGGNNQALRDASGDYVLLLNPDCVLQPDFVAHLTQALEGNPEAGSASGRLLRPLHHTLDSTGIVPNLYRLSPRDRDEGQPRSVERPGGEIFGPSGAAGFYRRAALDEVAVEGEILDEDFFAYYEDVDLAWRLQLRGWKSLYVPEALAEHGRRGPARPGSAIFWTAFVNRYFLVLKNAGWDEGLGILGRSLPRELVRVVRCALTRRSALGAVGRFGRLFPRMIRKRRWIRARLRAKGFRACRFTDR